jgi:hypothetical protein
MFAKNIDERISTKSNLKTDDKSPAENEDSLISFKIL